MQHLKGSTSDAGFSLIEVIVSFVILASILGSTALSLSYSARLNRQFEAKRSAVACAERLFAERFNRSLGVPGAETSTEGDGCRWRVSRKIVKAAYTSTGRNLVALRLNIINSQDVSIEAFDTYYVEKVR